MFRFVLMLLVGAMSLQGVIVNGAEPERSEPKTVHLLTIGNSFSRNATRFLEPLVTAGGHQLVHRPIIVGGASMELHATKALQHDADPDAKEGKYADGTSLKERLGEQRWDYVTIQQASRLSGTPSSYHPFAGQLRDYVKLHAPQAKLMIHETWAYREDDPWFVKPESGTSNPVTQEEMYNKLRASYFTIADELEAGVIPVGDAFHLATQDEKWKYRTDKTFDFSKAEFPQLPDQTYSLHTGWRWTTQDKTKKLQIDGHHANTAGEFLGACVFYETLYGDDVRKNAFVPKGFDPEFARFLKETAHQAVAAVQKK
ncbi:MAG TPA: DUF4886 domain-containing protein [Planctomicrobium sp.]|nr:DUF4886 domain-containing protein [Planctomicrobium sp.]